MDDPRTQLASVSHLLDQPRIVALIERFTRPLVLDAVHHALDRLRATLTPNDAPPSLDETLDRIEHCLLRVECQRLRPVVNATGVILHTGLGRAVLPRPAAEALGRLDRCCNLQIDLETGRRGARNFISERLAARLTGAEAALIVNNNAAATLLILTALCADKDVIVSRGQLIEIGGSYRLPDCIHQSGARLVEVGTTNKTHLRDYETAIGEATGAILRVNPSNYRIIGFSKEVPVEDLATLKQDHDDLLVIDDLGCGALIDLEPYGLPHEPTAPESIAAGADLVCFSGDKMIGGPQAGIIVGRKDLVQKIRKHPLTRMLRVDKLTDMALEHTLRMFLEPERLAEEHPTIRMITMTADRIKRRATRLANKIAKANPTVKVRVVECESTTGGGSLPAVPIGSWGLAIQSENLSADQLSRQLRRHEPPIISRIENDEVLLDLRTVFEDEEKSILNAVGSWE